MKVPVAFIIGDTEGHNKLCGKYGSHNKGAARVCRYCDCSFNNLDKPYHHSNLTYQHDIQQLFQEGDRETLHSISYHFVDNAFHKLCYGGDPHGIHGACLVEVLHAIQQGIMKYSKTGFITKLSESNK